VLKVNEGIGGPEFLLDLFPRHYIAGPLKERRENLERSLLELDLVDVASYFTASKVYFELSDAEARRCRRWFLHGGSPAFRFDHIPVPHRCQPAKILEKPLRGPRVLFPHLFTCALPRIYALCMDACGGLRKDAITIAQARWTRMVCRQTWRVVAHVTQPSTPPWLREKNMTLKNIVTVLGRPGVVFWVLAFIPDNLTHLTPGA
jgi:hypothetical protein